MSFGNGIDAHVLELRHVPAEVRLDSLDEHPRRHLAVGAAAGDTNHGGGGLDLEGDQLDRAHRAAKLLVQLRDGVAKPCLYDLRLIGTLEDPHTRS